MFRRNQSLLLAVAILVTATPVIGQETVIGEWVYTNRPHELLPVRARLYAEGEKHFFTEWYKDGSSGTREVTLTETRHGTEIRTVEERNVPDFWVINESGGLELWDDEGEWVTVGEGMEFSSS